MSARAYAAKAHKKVRRDRMTAAGMHRLLVAGGGGALRVSEAAEEQAKNAAEAFIAALAEHSGDILVFTKKVTVDVQILKAAAKQMGCAADLGEAFASSAAGSKTRKAAVFVGEEGSKRRTDKTRARGVKRDISVAAAVEAFKEAFRGNVRMTADAKVVVAEATMAWIKALGILAATFAHNCNRKTILGGDFQSAYRSKASCLN